VYVATTPTYDGVRCVIRRRQIIFGHVQNSLAYRAYRMYVTHTLTIRTAYTGYARHTLDIHLIHTLNTLKVRYSYVRGTLSIRYSYVCKGKWSIGGVYSCTYKKCCFF